MTLTRDIKPCETCPYRPIDLQLTRKFQLNGIKLNVFDIDLVIEIEKRIEAVIELKRYQDAAFYDTFYMPAHEYVCLKKVAKSLRCDAYFLVTDGTDYWISEVDRFNKKNSITFNGKRVIPFSRNGFRRLTESELKTFWFEKYGLRLVR